MIASMPMNVCAKPEPGIETNGELKPVAIALASIVLPVPGAPRKRRPRSRLPPARSNASPDCQMVTTRRTSSFASSWPRTSSSLTPHSRVARLERPDLRLMPISSIGPMRITKLAKKRKNTKIACIHSSRRAEDAADRAEHRADGAPPGHVRLARRATTNTVVTSRKNDRAEPEPEAPEPRAAASDDVLLAQLLALGAEQARPGDQSVEDEVGRSRGRRPRRRRSRAARPTRPPVLLGEPEEERRARQQTRRPWRRGSACANPARARSKSLPAAGLSSGSAVAIRSVYAGHGKVDVGRSLSALPGC